MASALIEVTPSPSAQLAIYCRADMMTLVVALSNRCPRLFVCFVDIQPFVWPFCVSVAQDRALTLAWVERPEAVAASTALPTAAVAMWKVFHAAIAFLFVEEAGW